MGLADTRSASSRRDAHTEQRQFAHRAEGLAALVAWLSKRCGAVGSVAIGIEVPHGAVVETLLEHGFAVFSLNPKQLDRFRDRHSVDGAKDDRLDAFVLADALRSDRHKFKRLSIPDETALALREVSRCYDTLKVDLNRLANRLREQLQRYFPQLLELCPAANEPLALGATRGGRRSSTGRDAAEAARGRAARATPQARRLCR